MLSNWASYLLGYGSAAGPEEQENIRVTAVEAEDEDWLVVDTVPGSGARSRSSSLDSTVEESWFVTPPPCFTSVGPVSVETSPLENLLIEHPSMSVYRRVRRSPSPAEPAPAPRHPPANPPARQPLRPAPLNTPAIQVQATQASLFKRAQKNLKHISKEFGRRILNAEYTYLATSLGLGAILTRRSTQLMKNVCL